MPPKLRLETRITNSGITLAITDQERARLEPAPNTPQTRPRGFYVYGHRKADGTIFYIGKGTDRRAWSEDRHPTWHRYVEKHLRGWHSVVILQDDLTEAEAEELESEWIAQESETLVNWINFGRKIDFERNRQLHTLRDANRALIDEAKVTESTDLEKAAAMYIEAIAASGAYANWDDEAGLVGQLLREEREEEGLSGEHTAINRLTMCLVKLGRAEDANFHAARYFEKYAADRKLSAYATISRRIEKALARTHRISPKKPK